MSWTCPHEVKGHCKRLNKCCQPGIKGCLLGGWVKFIDKNRLNKNEFSTVLNVTPRLSKLFEDCNELVFLTGKFKQEDQEDLNKRFKDCHRTKGFAVAKDRAEV